MSEIDTKDVEVYSPDIDKARTITYGSNPPPDERGDPNADCFVFILVHGIVDNPGYLPLVIPPSGKVINKLNKSSCGFDTYSPNKPEAAATYITTKKNDMLNKPFNECITKKEVVDYMEETYNKSRRKKGKEEINIDAENICEMQSTTDGITEFIGRFYYPSEVKHQLCFFIKRDGPSDPTLPDYREFNILFPEELAALLIYTGASDNPEAQRMLEFWRTRVDPANNTLIRPADEPPYISPYVGKVFTEDIFAVCSFIPQPVFNILDLSCATSLSNVPFKPTTKMRYETDNTRPDIHVSNYVTDSPGMEGISKNVVNPTMAYNSNPESPDTLNPIMHTLGPTTGYGGSTRRRRRSRGRKHSKKMSRCIKHQRGGKKNKTIRRGKRSRGGKRHKGIK